MGGLYGSEYWTYTLPKRVGPAMAQKLTEECAPIGVQESRQLGLIDDVLIQDNYGVNNFQQFENQIRGIATRFAAQERSAGLSHLKTAIRTADEQRKPLAQYRHEELEQMKRNFWGGDRSYHIARSAFVRKQLRQGGLLPNGFSAGVTANGDGPARLAKDRHAYDTTGWSSTIGQQ
jgi:putative two-component system hydrogenase maturation factor HypX/HoxX